MAQHSEPVSGGLGSPMESQAGAREMEHRPGMLTFAVVMFMVAGLEALSAILAFAGTGWWVTDAGNLVYANFVLWGIVDSIIALIALYAGIDLLRGGGFGRGMAYVFAVVGHQMAICHPGGTGASGGSHRALRDGCLRPCQALRLLSGCLSARRFGLLDLPSLSHRSSGAGDADTGGKSRPYRPSDPGPTSLEASFGSPRWMSATRRDGPYSGPWSKPFGDQEIRPS